MATSPAEAMVPSASATTEEPNAPALLPSRRPALGDRYAVTVGCLLSSTIVPGAVMTWSMMP